MRSYRFVSSCNTMLTVKTTDGLATWESAKAAWFKDTGATRSNLAKPSDIHAVQVGTPHTSQRKRAQVGHS